MAVDLLLALALPSALPRGEMKANSDHSGKYVPSVLMPSLTLVLVIRSRIAAWPNTEKLVSISTELSACWRQ